MPLLNHVRFGGANGAACVAAALAIAFVGASAGAQTVITDDFNDGNDAGWTRVDPRAGTPDAATFSFSNGGYRIQVPAVGTDMPRVGSFRTDATYTDFLVEADIIDWDPATIPQMSVMARATLGGPGEITGYVLTATPGGLNIQRYDPNFTSGGGGGSFVLTPGNDYRLRFHGLGAGMAGELIDLATGEPIGFASFNDATYTSGVSGLLVQDNGNHLPVDVTFDNFLATVPEPTAAAALLGGAMFTLRRRRKSVPR